MQLVDRRQSTPTSSRVDPKITKVLMVMEGNISFGAFSNDLDSDATSNTWRGVDCFLQYYMSLFIAFFGLNNS